jgi:hypothetical protein
MVLGQTRPPPSDGEQREVEVVGQLRHLVEQAGVAGEVRREPTLHQVPERVARRGHGMARDAVHGGSGGQPQAADVAALPRLHLGHVRESEAPDEPLRRARGEHRCVLVDEAQRWDVEVVEVRVRDDDRVEVAVDARRRQRAVTDERAHAQPQQRVGEDARAVHLDEDGGMAHKGRRQRGGRRLCAHTRTIWRGAPP